VQTFLVDAEQPASALRAELDARRLRPRTVALGLPRAAVVVKPLDLPPVGGELGDMVRFELERHVPFPAEDAPFDFVPLRRERDRPADRRVLLVAADRRVVDGVVRLAQDANLRPASVTVASHDLPCLVRVPRQRIVWAHRVETEANLLLLDGPSIVWSRQVPVGDEAELAGEVRRSLAAVRWATCDALWVSGDADVEEAANGPLGDLAVPVTAPPYTAGARRRLAGLGRQSRGAAELALAVALGRRGRPLDLLPPALRPRRLTRAQALTVATGAAAVALTVAALLAPGYRDRQRLAALTAEIARLEPEVRAVEAIRAETERRRRLVRTIESLEPSSVKPLPVLRELTDLLPTEAWLTVLSLDGKGVELTGQAAAASALIPLLENSPRFERVEFASPVTRGRDREQFRIVAKWEGHTGGATQAPADEARRPPAAPPGGSRR
jgi:Tfp pilus assembly protein PilN